MNNNETLIFLKGKKEGLRQARERIKIVRNEIEEMIKLTIEDIKERK